MEKFDYVLVLAEERNLTRAANRLYISQPTLTNYINRLEASLGIKLFDRTVQPIEVTEAGLLYIEDMKKIQIREAALYAKLDALKDDKHTFTIGAPSLRSAYDLPQVLTEFMKLYPTMNVTVDNRLEEDLEKALAKGEVDVAMGMLSTAYPNIHYDCIQEDRIYLLVPRQKLPQLRPNEGTLANPYLLDSERLGGMTMLLSRMGGGHYRIAMRMIERYGITPQNTLSCNNMNLLYQLVGEGVGFMFSVPTPFMRGYPQYTDSIAFCTLQEDALFQKVYVGYLDNTPRMGVIKNFVGLLKEARKNDK